MLEVALGSTVYRNIPGGYALPVSLAKNIRRLRRAANLTQTQLGEALGVGQAAVSRWEKAKTLPDATILPRLALTIGSTLDLILQGEEAQYDAGRDLLGQAGTGHSGSHPKGESDAPAKARIPQPSFDPKIAKEIRALSTRLVKLSGDLVETRTAERPKTGPARGHRRTG